MAVGFDSKEFDPEVTKIILEILHMVAGFVHNKWIRLINVLL